MTWVLSTHRSTGLHPSPVSCLQVIPRHQFKGLVGGAGLQGGLGRSEPANHLDHCDGLICLACKSSKTCLFRCLGATGRVDTYIWWLHWPRTLRVSVAPCYTPTNTLKPQVRKCIVLGCRKWDKSNRTFILNVFTGERVAQVFRIDVVTFLYACYNISCCYCHCYYCYYSCCCGGNGQPGGMHILDHH